MKFVDIITCKVKNSTTTTCIRIAFRDYNKINDCRGACGMLMWWWVFVIATVLCGTDIYIEN